MAKITVLGAGGWGMALAISACGRGNDITIWSPFLEEIKLLSEKRANEKLLPGVILPDEIKLTTDMACVEDSVITIMAVPSIAVRSVAKSLAQYKNFGIVVDVSKGIEQDSLKRLSQVLEDELGNINIVALSGPSHAEEVARGIPTSIVAASKSLPSAQIVQDIMTGENLRIYTSGDIIGAELGGALKNIIAIAAGICEGLGLGDNTKAAMITRGLSEMARLGVCMGAKEYTFAGLTGIGDLIVTCTSRHSRNNRFGQLVGKGEEVKVALEKVGTVEGYYATYSAYNLAKKYRITMPIIEECYAILYENKNVKQSLLDLMNRPSRSEH